MRFLLKILTLGMAGGTTQQSGLRTVFCHDRPPMFGRASEKATRKVVQKYFLEREADYVMRSIGTSSRTLLMFESDSVALSFYKDLQRIGWDYEELPRLESLRPHFYDAEFSTYRDCGNAFIREDVEITYEAYCSGPGKYYDAFYDEPVQRLSDLKPKEVKKYVTLAAA